MNVPTHTSVGPDLYPETFRAVAPRNMVPLAITVAVCMVAGTGLFVLQWSDRGKIANAEAIPVETSNDLRVREASACAAGTWPYLSDECLARPPGLVRVLPPTAMGAAPYGVEERVESQTRFASEGSKIPLKPETRSTSRTRLARKTSRDRRPTMGGPDSQFAMTGNSPLQRYNSAVQNLEPRRWMW